MPVELLVLLALVALFLISVTLQINMGICALVAAFLVGTQLVGLPVDELLAGFPVNIFLSVVGIMFLLGIARDNHTMDWLVARAIGMARGRIALLPWILFGLSAVTATLGPGVAPLLIGMGGTLSARHSVNPLLTSAMVIHGTQGGAFSPVAPYGVIINGLVERNGLTPDPFGIYFAVLGFHIVLACVVFFLFGGRKLIGMRIEQTQIADELDRGVPSKPNALQILTLVGFAALFAGALFFHMNIGLLALTIGALLLIITPRQRRHEAVAHIAWPIVLVISGILTYIAIMEKADSVNWLGTQLSHFGGPVVVALMLCFLIGSVTAFASTLGTIGILIPLCVPFLLSGDIHLTGTIAALAICAAVTDVCPFSTYGALALASAPPDRREQLNRQMLLYTGGLMATVPLLTWSLLILPRW